jgi:hypothetical protein
LSAGEAAGFVYPMGVRGEDYFRQIAAERPPPAIFASKPVCDAPTLDTPTRAPRALSPQHVDWCGCQVGWARSSDSIGSFYHQSNVFAADSLGTVDLNKERSTYSKRRIEALPVADAAPRRWVGGPIMTPPGKHHF